MNGPTNITIGPTETLYAEINSAYRYFNKTLFDSQLPECLITLQRQNGHLASTSMYRFVRMEDEAVFTHELSVNPSYFADSTPKGLLSNLVHEMVHMELALTRGPDAKTKGYHDKVWSRRMEAIGLIPSDTGKVGGEKIGFRMLHYVQPNGLFDQAAQTLLEHGWKLTWIDRVARKFVIEEMDDGEGLAPPEDDDEDPEGAPADTTLQVQTSDAPSGNTQAHVSDDASSDSNTPHEVLEARARCIEPSSCEDSVTETAPFIHPGTAPDFTAEYPQKDYSAFNRRPSETMGHAMVAPPPKKASNSGKRDKYVCPECQLAVWAKLGGVNVNCGDCNTHMVFEPPTEK